MVTLDADGQHRPDEMERLVKPILDGEVEMAHGSRVLGHADRNHFARELGIVFFNRLVSFITRTHVTDCSNGYRAVRTTVLPQLVLRQEQFHTSEFMIEAIKRGDPRQGGPDHGRPAFARALEEAGGLPLRDGLRQRDRPDLAAVGRRGRDGDTPPRELSRVPFGTAPGDGARLWRAKDRLHIARFADIPASGYPHPSHSDRRRGFRQAASKERLIPLRLLCCRCRALSRPACTC